MLTNWIEIKLSRNNNENDFTKIPWAIVLFRKWEKLKEKKQQ